MASWLLDEAHINVGDRAMLVFFPGLHFMISLVVCPPAWQILHFSLP
jgi:hypothetical protein